MQADVIDYDELYTGKRREAQYTAFWSMLPKFVAIPSAAIPIAVLASLGYIPNASAAPRVVFAIRAIFALAPATCSALSFLIARRYPITETIHSEILEGIEVARARRGGRRSDDRRDRAAAEARPRRGRRLVPRLLFQRRVEALSRQGRVAAGARRADDGGGVDRRLDPFGHLRAGTRQHRSAPTPAR